MSKSYIPKAIRQQVIKKSKGYCEYCLSPADFSPSPFCLDHIVPEVLNGKTIFNNLAYACGGCNGYKHDKISSLDSITNSKISLYNPRTDNWNEHFYWSNDELTLNGRTPKGRITIDLLKINREQSINLRSILRLVGLHPPTDYP